MTNKLEELEKKIQKEIIEKTEHQRLERKKKVKTNGLLSKRGRKKKRGKMYFTLETENAIILYNKLKDPIAKNIIYNRYIKEPIEKLVENVFNTFKFSYFDAPSEDIQNEVVSNIILNIHKYREGKGRAFSYFSIVAKNYLILVNNGNYGRYKKSQLISTMPENWEVEDDFWISQRKIESNEFVQLMLTFWDEHLNVVFNRKRDIQIADSVLELFRQSERIELFNKKALYCYIREMTDCKTQYITKVVKTMKDIQTEMFEEYRSRGNIDTTRTKYEHLFW